MAVLTDQDYGEIRDAAYQGVCKADLKALAALPSKTQFKAAFQSMENDMVSAFPGIKSNFDAALGVTTSANLGRRLFAAYLRWKLKQMGV